MGLRDSVRRLHNQRGKSGFDRPNYSQDQSGKMTRDDYLTIFIISLFILAPLISAFIDGEIQDLKAYIDKRLAPHGLRLKRRG